MRRAIVMTVMAAVLAVGAAPASVGSYHDLHLYSVAVDGSDLRRIGDGAAYRATLSPGGRKIAFYRLSTADPRPYGFSLDLWLMDADGSNERRLAAPTGSRHIPLTDGVWGPVWSPTGEKIAFDTSDFSRCTPSATKCAIGEINIVDLRSGSITRIAGANVGGRGAANPSWSPTGKRIVFEGNLGLFSDDPKSIYVANADGSRRKRIVAGEDVSLSPQAWSPNGRWIAYTKWGRVIHVASPSGAPHRSIAPGHSPTWAPNGQLLAFVGDTIGDGIYTVRPNGQGRRYVTELPGAGRWYVCCGSVPPLIAWLPDGTRIAFVCCEGPERPDRSRGRKSEHIYVVRPDGRGKRQITSQPPSPDFTFPSSDRFDSLFWSRDGRRIFFISGDPAFRVTSQR